MTQCRSCSMLSTAVKLLYTIYRVHKQYALAIGRALIGDYTSRRCVTIAEKTLSISATPQKAPHVCERLPGKKLGK